MVRGLALEVYLDVPGTVTNLAWNPVASGLETHAEGADPINLEPLRFSWTLGSCFGERQPGKGGETAQILGAYSRLGASKVLGARAAGHKWVDCLKAPSLQSILRRVRMLLDHPLKRCGEAGERTIAGETLLVAIRTNPREKVSVLTLNQVGTFVWAALAAPTTPRLLAQAVTDEFEVSFDQALADLVPFLERLRELGLADGA